MGAQTPGVTLANLKTGLRDFLNGVPRDLEYCEISDGSAINEPASGKLFIQIIPVDIDLIRPTDQEKIGVLQGENQILQLLNVTIRLSRCKDKSDSFAGDRLATPTVMISDDVSLIVDQLVSLLNVQWDVYGGIGSAGLIEHDGGVVVAEINFYLHVCPITSVNIEDEETAALASISADEPN